MKNKNWINTLPVMLLLLVLVSFNSCTTDPGVTPDYASKIAGTYIGTTTIVGSGTVTCSSRLTRSSDLVVDLEIIIGTSNIPLDGITVSEGTNNTYDLKYTDSSGTFEGKVDGNKLTWTIISGSTTETFIGTK